LGSNYYWVKGEFKVLAQSVSDSRLGDVIRRHLDTDPVAGGETDKMFSHFPRNMCQYFMAIVKHHPKHRSGQNGLNGSFQFNWLFGAHS
jgi:hypothetical protein